MLHEACMNGKLNVAQYLVEQCLVNVNVKNCRGAPALHEAVKMGRLDIVQLLTGLRKADVNVTEHCGRTAMHWACAMGKLDMVQYLLEQCSTNANAHTGVSSRIYSGRDLYFCSMRSEDVV